jgi:uncharacterized membrane protein (UPF0127 family)
MITTTIRHTFVGLVLYTVISSAAIAMAKPVSVAVCIDGHEQVIRAEIADTDASRARGLMMREQLGQHDGMWFRYRNERSGDSGFWMYNTWIPLDIAYLDSQQRIVKIIQMQPCDSIDPGRCAVYRPNVPYYGALEMNLGYFAEHQITIGAKVRECPAR